MSALVICCGNTLRGDDGVGARVAAELAQEIAVLDVVQLQAEHADAIREHERIVFVDATREGAPGDVRWQTLDPVEPQSAFTHHVEPRELLALARTLYGACPAALQVTIGGARFELYEGLSPEVAAAVPRVVRLIAGWIRESEGDRSVLRGDGLTRRQVTPYST